MNRDRGDRDLVVRLVGGVGSPGLVLSGLVWLACELALDSGVRSSWLTPVSFISLATLYGDIVIRYIVMRVRRSRFDAATPNRLDSSVAADTAGIVVRGRPTFWADRFLVWIDDQYVGLIAAGETSRFEVPPGDHHLAVRGRHRIPVERGCDAGGPPCPVPPDQQWGVSLLAGESGDFVCSSTIRRDTLEPTPVGSATPQ